MEKHHSRFKLQRNILIFWCLFVGIGAVVGASCMLIEPDGSILGMDKLLVYFQVLPFAKVLFQDFVFSGIALLCVNGITNIVAAVLLMKNKKSGVVCGMVFGITLMLWICIQFIIFPPNFMSTIYFIFGALQAICGYTALVFYRQEHFVPLPKNCENIGTDKSHLVVYFSRMGYVKRLAFEEAQRTGADLYEVRAAEKTDGTLGFWWCGRYGMHGWDMMIEKPTVDLSSYSHVTICTPIWVFDLAAPMKSFCREAKGRISEADYILVHHTQWKYTHVVKKMDELLCVKHSGAVSVCCQKGKYRKKTIL